MSKRLSCGTIAKIGMNVKVIKGGWGYNRGTETVITAISGTIKNKGNLDVDLDRWSNIVECGEWLQNIYNLKFIK